MTDTDRSAPRVLVAYATADGSTAGVAERIAAVLHDAGLGTTCRPAGPDLSLTGYDAVVLGSAVHEMAWLPPAVEVLRRAVAESASPLWCFSVGGVDPAGRLTGGMAAMEVRRVEQGFPPGTAPVEHRLFRGIVRTQGVPLWGRIFYRLTGGRPGDHRDWPAIEAWARTIAATLRDARPAAPGAGR
jgi:menaquinone-dependent protoporphyrinogen oxidase